MKRKLPSYTLEEALHKSSLDFPESPSNRMRKLFARDQRITARDILKTPARSFGGSFFIGASGVGKCFFCIPLDAERCQGLVVEVG